MIGINSPSLGGALFQEKRGNLNRESLAEALSFWSLGHQKDLREEIAQLPMPILWVVGEKDDKFLSLAKGLSFKHPLSRVLSMPESGHRVLFDASFALERAFQEFLAQVL